jgi:conjugative relaxase-like TrwC/TraI family protein
LNASKHSGDKMLTYRVGSAGSASAAKDMAQYLGSSENVPELQTALAEYYTQTSLADEHGALAIPRADMHPLIAERLGIDPTRPVSGDELMNLLQGLRTDGTAVPGSAPKRNGYVDLTLSAPKSVSLAIIMAPTADERHKLDKAHRDAVNSTIAHISTIIGTASIGDTSYTKAAPKREMGHIAVIMVDHHVARPVRKEADGQDTKLIPEKYGDPQRHTHCIIPNLVVTDEGRCTRLHSDGLDQRVHELGSIYSAYLATNLRALGVNVELDSRPGLNMNERMARLTDVPQEICDVFSKLGNEGERRAKKFAKDHGVDYERLSVADQVAARKGGIADARDKKAKEPGQYESWMTQASDAGYKHRSVLRPGAEQTLRPAADRHKHAYDVALPLIDEQLERRAVLEGSVPRVAAAKGLIAAGIESADEVNAITAAMRTEGVQQDGQTTSLHWAFDPAKRYARVTTQLSVAMEQEAIGLLQAAAADKSVALSPEQIERAVQTVSARDGLDFTTEHGLKQREFIDKIGAAGRAAVGIGVAGSGKAQPDTAMVLTPTGFRPMGSLVVGDLITCPDGSVVPIIGVYPQGERDIYSITFDDGRTTQCCDDHLWKVWSSSRIVQPVVDTSGLETIGTPYGGRVLDLTLGKLLGLSKNGADIRNIISRHFSKLSSLGDGFMTRIRVHGSRVFTEYLLNSAQVDFLVGRTRPTYRGNRGEGRRTRPGEFLWLVRPLSEIRRWFSEGLSRVERSGVPLVSPFAIELPHQHLPIPPYTLGALLGDGHFSNEGGVHLSTADDHILQVVSSELPDYVYRRSGIQDYRFSLKDRTQHTRGTSRLNISQTIGDFPTTGGRRERLLTFNGVTMRLSEWAVSCGLDRRLVFNRLVKSGWSVGEALGFDKRPAIRREYSPLAIALRGLGLNGSRSHNKFLPTIYKNGSVAQRVAILQGLMDTDGSVGNGTCASLTSTSEQLARDVQEIAWSLGARAKISPRQTYCSNGKNGRVAGKPSWRVSIVHPDVSMMFTLPSKVAKCTKKVVKHRLGITSIEFVGRKLARCIVVDHRDHLYVTDDYIVTHNSSALRPLVEAWHENGRQTYGVTLAWRQTQGLRDAGVGKGQTRGKRKVEPIRDTLAGAGIAAERTFALVPFLKRVHEGKIKLDANSTVIIDEIALVGTKQILDLSRLQAQHGFHVVGIGDDLQCQPISAGATIDLARRAFGSDAVPELLSSTRQLAERDRETAQMWREGKATEALARKDEDGTLRIVPGGYAEAVKATVDLWSERIEANRNQTGYSIGISVPTNADGRAIGESIRLRRRASGEIGPDLLSLAAGDQNGETYTLLIASGDRIRLFDRVRGRDSTGRVSIAGVNGTVVEVLHADRNGMDVRKPSGLVARIGWDDLRRDGGPVRASYGDAVTIDARQSDTVTEHITSMPSGSAGVNGFKAYVSESRHRQAAWIVTSQGAEKDEIQQRRPLGDPRNRETDVSKVKGAVLENMARNMAEQPKKTLATDFMERAVNLRSGTMGAEQAGWHNATGATVLPTAAPVHVNRNPKVESDITTPSAMAQRKEDEAIARAMEAMRNVIAVPPPTAEETAIARRAALVADGRWAYSEALDNMLARYIRTGGDIEVIDKVEERYGLALAQAAGAVEDSADKRGAIQVLRDGPLVTQAERDAARAIAPTPTTNTTLLQAHEAEQSRIANNGMER